MIRSKGWLELQGPYASADERDSDARDLFGEKHPVFKLFLEDGIPLVGRVLGCAQGLVSVHGEARLKKYAGGKCCDFHLELPGEILLDETKAVSFTKTVLTEKSIAEDTSTRRIAEGVRNSTRPRTTCTQGGSTSWRSTRPSRSWVSSSRWAISRWWTHRNIHHADGEPEARTAGVP
jgi:hypothetical protein